MNGKIDIYCEFGFLEKFYSTLPQNHDRNNPKAKYWRDLDELFCRHSCVVMMDVDDATYYKQSEKNENEDVKYFLQALWADGNIECAPSKSMEKAIGKNNGVAYFADKTQALFFLDASLEKCKKLADDYGLMFISNYNFAEWANFLFSSSIELVNEKTKNWDFVKQFKHPCNSITLIDNYILDKDDDTLKKDIRSLFNALLPLQLNNTVFNIYIYSYSKYRNSREEEDKKKIIRNAVNELRRKYEIRFKFPFYTLNNDHHDRYLLTNYCMFNSGYGFALRESERKTGTSLMVWPLTYLSQYGDKASRNNVFEIMQFLRKK